jgi:pimeloyl-ACP methyl ester carboxylesterase
MKPFLRIASLSLALLALQPVARAGALHDHPGYWLGNVTLPDGQVRKLGVELFNRADGAAWASAAWPEQDVVDIPVKAIRAEPGDAFVLDLGAASLKLAWVKDHFDGEWKQGKATLKADLRQVAAYPRRARPQTPQAPFPYRNETLAIHSTDGVTLGATLSIPAAPAHPNVVVLVAGSGPMSRHADVEGHLLFDVLADHLARQGVAVLRYDKRGISRSTGDYYGHTTAQLADDLQAALQALAVRKEFGRIGLVGHSEGSQVAAAVAARHPEVVGFVVSLGGVGLSGFDLELLQDRQWARDNGAGHDEVERITPYLRKYYGTVLATPDGEARIVALKSLYAGLAPEDQALITKYRMNVGTLAPDMAARPFLPVELKSDPRKDWSVVRCPVLVLNGSLDHQVPPEEDVAGIVGALKAGGNTSVEAAVLPSLNHVFQTAQTGKEDEYARIDETMAPVALQKVADFARKQH